MKEPVFTIHPPALPLLAMLIAFLTGACGGASQTGHAPQPAASSSQPAADSDPFAYCAAVGTVDLPDQRYHGPALPDSVIQAMIKADVVSADSDSEFQRHAMWRCMNGHVFACHFGANIPCDGKANTSKDPTPEMHVFCKEHVNDKLMPAYLTGHDTIWDWQCDGPTPVARKQMVEVDPRGYIADFWYELKPVR